MNSERILKENMARVWKTETTNLLLGRRVNVAGRAHAERTLKAHGYTRHHFAIMRANIEARIRTYGDQARFEVQR